MMEDLMMRLELLSLQDRYVATLDNDRIEEWPALFTEDCLYEIVSKENEDLGLPAPVIHCDNVRMLRDRVVALRNANIYEKPAYRHCLSMAAPVTRSPVAPNNPTPSQLPQSEGLIEEYQLLRRIYRKRSSEEETAAIGELGEAIAAVDVFSDISGADGQGLSQRRSLSLVGRGCRLMLLPSYTKPKRFRGRNSCRMRPRWW